MDQTTLELLAALERRLGERIARLEARLGMASPEHAARLAAPPPDLKPPRRSPRASGSAAT